MVAVVAGNGLGLFNASLNLLEGVAGFGQGVLGQAGGLGSIDVIPAAGLVLVLGGYRFISEGGALINVIGNGVATLFIARWDGALDREQLKRELG